MSGSVSTVPLEQLVDPGRPITYGIVLPGPDVPNGVPYVRVVDIQEGTIRAEQLRRTTHEIAKSHKRSMLATGDLVVSIRGHVGRTALVPSSADGANLTQDTARIAIRSDVDAQYVRWFIESPVARQWMAQHTKGVAVTGINLGDLRKLPVPAVPLDEQHRIANVLDKADGVRRKRRETIALYGQLLRSAFLEMFGDPVRNPRGWPVKALGELADAQSGVAKGKRYAGQAMVTLPYMRVANVQDGRIVLDEVKTIEVSEAEGLRYRLRAGDVLLTEGGDPDKLGRGAVWHGEIGDCIHQNHIFRVRPGPDIRSEFLSAIIASERGKRYFLRAAKQTTGIATINMTQLRAFPVLMPPLDRQNAYVRFIDRARSVREKLRHHADTVDGVFNSLVAGAFSREHAP